MSAQNKTSTHYRPDGKSWSSAMPVPVETIRQFVCSCNEDECPRWDVVKTIIDRCDRYEAALTVMRDTIPQSYHFYQGHARRALDG